MTNTIKKSDLIENLHITLGLNKRESKELLEALLEEIIFKNFDIHYTRLIK